MKKKPKITEQKFENIDPELMKEIGNRYRSIPAPKPTKTTFQLTERGYELLNELADRKGSSVGSVISDVAECMSGELFPMVMKQCLENPIEGKRIRRSYAVETQTLKTLQYVQDRVSSHHNEASRDDLIETTVNIFYQLTEESDKRLVEKLRELRDTFETIVNQFYDFEKKSKVVLSEYPDHPVLNRIGYIILFLDNLCGAIDSEIKDGIPVDPDDYSQC